MNTSPLQQKIFHRLSYQALPSTISTPSTTELDGSLVHSVSPLVKTLSYEVELPRPDLTEDSRESELTGDWDTEVEQPSLSFVPHISLGYQRCIDLMMPDRSVGSHFHLKFAHLRTRRTMDMQLSIVDSSTLSEDQAPQELTQYTTNMKE